MSDDLTNDECLKTMEAAEKEYDSFPMCEGVSYIDNKKQFVVEQVGGRILLVSPNNQNIDKNTLCKLLEMKGMNYEQAHVTKRENFSLIENEKTTSLLTLGEIINNHTPVWLDTYENDRKGSRILIGEKIFSNHNFNYDKTNENDIIFDEDLLSYNTEHTNFLDDHSSSGKGKKIEKSKEKELTTTTLKVENVSDIFINSVSSIVRLNNLKVGTLYIIQNSIFMASTGNPV